MSFTAIFFDAGNTLIFPDRSRTLGPLLALGVEPTQEQLWAAERLARQRRDQAAGDGHQRLGDHEYWHLYYGQLFDALGIGRDVACDAPALMQALIAASRRSANWDEVLPGTREALLEMRRRYRLAVISNSDGHMGELIARVGLGDCFEAVIDSGNLGVEKPDARIFRAGAAQLGVAPGDCLYVGDVYSIDYLGARGAGFEALLFDVCGAYRESPLPRVESLQELQSRVMTHARS